MPTVYRCSACGGVFESEGDWTNADALAEASRTFTEEELASTDVVSETCWQEMLAAMPALAARYEASERADGN